MAKQNIDFFGFLDSPWRCALLMVCVCHRPSSHGGARLGKINATYLLWDFFFQWFNEWLQVMWGFKNPQVMGGLPGHPGHGTKGGLPGRCLRHLISLWHEMSRAIFLCQDFLSSCMLTPYFPTFFRGFFTFPSWTIVGVNTHVFFVISQHIQETS